MLLEAIWVSCMIDDVVLSGPASVIISYLDKDENYIKKWDLAEHREKKRTLTSNNYYWKLIDLLSLEEKIPKPELHNMYLREVGRLKLFNGKAAYILLPDDEETERAVIRSSSYHYMPTDDTTKGKDGNRYRWYVQLKGSKEFNTREMNMLIDLIIQDAQAVGIQTLTYEELAEMRERERKKEEKYGKH